MQISKAQQTDLQALIDLENTTFLSDKISKNNLPTILTSKNIFLSLSDKIR